MPMKWLVALLLSAALASPVLAASCDESREYLLDGLAGDLPAPASRYQDVFKACIAALNLTNVKDAYVLLSSRGTTTCKEIRGNL
jgi:hypothetical protein